MPVLPIPHRCIWCGREGPDVKFDVSHVVPKALGNEAQVLPPGIVCKPCNNFFQKDVEKELLSNPMVRLQAAALNLRFPHETGQPLIDIYRDAHDPVLVPQMRRSDTRIGIRSDSMTLNVIYEKNGEAKTFTLEKHYAPRQLAFLSRSVHKMVFEGLAWIMYVRGNDQVIPLNDPVFDVTRAWARYGRPQNAPLPVFQGPGTQALFGGSAPAEQPRWILRHWERGGHFWGELDMWGIRFAVSLTAAPNVALKALLEWAGEPQHGIEKSKFWYFSDALTRWQ